MNEESMDDCSKDAVRSFAAQMGVHIRSLETQTERPVNRHAKGGWPSAKEIVEFLKPLDRTSIDNAWILHRQFRDKPFDWGEVDSSLEDLWLSTVGAAAGRVLLCERAQKKAAAVVLACSCLLPPVIGVAFWGIWVLGFAVLSADCELGRNLQQSRAEYCKSMQEFCEAASERTPFIVRHVKVRDEGHHKRFSGQPKYVPRYFEALAFERKH
jgi:hypothetical protein